MQKTYARVIWENEPSTNTPLNEINLNRMDAALDVVDDRVVTFDTTKANQSDLLQSIKNITYNSTTGVFVFTWWNGTTLTADLNIEKIPVSFSMSPQGVITMKTADGTTYTCDISTLIKTYTFTSGDVVLFTTTTDSSGNKTITATIADGSITEEMLETNFLADCRLAVAQAESAARNSQDYAANSADFSLVSEGWAKGTQEGVPVEEDSPYYHDNSKYWKEQAEFIVGNKMDKINPRGTGSFAMNQEDETSIGLNAFVGGGGEDEKISSEYTYQACSITYASEDDDSVTYNTSIDLTQISDITITHMQTDTWTKFAVLEVTSSTIKIAKSESVTDYTGYTKINRLSYYGFLPSKATGRNAFAFGQDCDASGSFSVAMGDGAIAQNGGDISLGYHNKARGESSVAMGAMNETTGYGSVAMGYGNKASGSYAVAMGENNEATHLGCVAMGYESKAKNGYAFAAGNNTEAGYCATAVGQQSKATGSYSFATGDRSVASGSSSVAEGYMCEAKGQDHAEGMGTIATGNGQHAEGMYNIEDTEEKYLHIVGNGTGPNDRSNAMTVDRQGNTWTAGKFSFGTDSNVCDEHETKLVEDYWGQEPEFDDWTNYLIYGREESGATKVSGDAITGTAIYDIPEGWISGVTYVIDDQSIINSLAGKTIEIGAIGYDYTFAKDNKVTFRYRYSGSYDFFYQHTDNVNSGSEIISDNVSGLAMRVTIPDDNPIDYLQFYFVSNTHNPVQTSGTLELTKAYVIDINEYELPKRDNTYIKMKRINTSNPTGLDPNTLYFNKYDKKIYFTNNVGDATVFGELASASAPGVVKPDGITTQVDQNGTLSVIQRESWIGSTTIPEGSTTYTITNSSILATSAIDIYYDEDSKDTVIEAAVSYTQSVGSITIEFENALTDDVTIRMIHVFNPVIN